MPKSFVRLKANMGKGDAFTSKVHKIRSDGEKTFCGMVLVDNDKRIELPSQGMSYCSNCARTEGTSPQMEEKHWRDAESDYYDVEWATVEEQLKHTQEAAVTVINLWDRFTQAKSPVAQAEYIVELSNAMFDLSTWTDYDLC